MNESSIKVFLSYRWENDDHENRVLELAMKLISHGIDCKLDKREQSLNKGNTDWKLWIDRELPTANFILVICTEGYTNCFNSEESCTGEGGVEYEARLIRNALSDNSVFPIILNENDKNHIPICMANFGRYDLLEAQFNIDDSESGYCSLVRKITNQPQFNFPELGEVPLLPPVNEVITLNEYSTKMSEQYKFIIDYLNSNSIQKDKLIEICRKYLKKIYINILIKYETLDEIINHISDYEQFPCIVRELYQTYDETLKSWLDSEDQTICIEVENIDDIPRLLIIFKSKHDVKKYNLTFISKNIPNISDGKSDEDFDLNVFESKDRLMVKIMSYVQTANPKVDLILPAELLIEDINLWEAGFNESLSRLSRLNIRDIGRYNIDDNMKHIIKRQWGTVLNKIRDHQSLCCIDNEDSIRNIGNNMNESGIASKYILQEKHFTYLLKTEMSYIMLWFTKESTEDLSALYTANIHDLQEKYFGLQNSPINLMWDDPATYYYPDEIQGERNE